MTAIAAPFAGTTPVPAGNPVYSKNRRMEETPPTSNVSPPLNLAFPRAAYPSDLSDAQWERIELLLPERKTTGRTGRPPRYSLRELLNGILYAQRTGCAWRYMPRDLPHWTSVYAYWQKWTRDGTLTRVQAALRGTGSSAGAPTPPTPLSTTSLPETNTAPADATENSQNSDGAPQQQRRRRRRIVVSARHRRPTGGGGSGRTIMDGAPRQSKIVTSFGTAEPMLLKGSKGGNTGSDTEAEIIPVSDNVPDAPTSDTAPRLP